MRKYQAKYRTKDSCADYHFIYEEQPDGTWRAYINWQPSYRDRSIGSHSTHRLSDGNRKYICWDGPLLTLQQAKEVSALWADKTQEYIKNGTRF